MDSTRLILMKLLEDTNLNEVSFIYNGKTYTSAFGRYTCNGEPITRDAYHNARDLYDNQGISKDNVDVTSSDADYFRMKEDELNKFVNEFSIDVEEALPPDKSRNHIEKKRPTVGYSGDQYDDDFGDNTLGYRIDTVMKDLKVNENDAANYVHNLKEYTVSGDYDEDVIDELLEQLPPYQGGLLYRGMEFSNDEEALLEFSQAKPGELLSLRGPTSFSSDYAVASTFAGTGKNRITDPDRAKAFTHVMIVNSRNLTAPSVNHLSIYPDDEKEILARQSTKLEVQGKKQFGDTLYIHVKELPLEESNNPKEILLPISGPLHPYKRDKHNHR